MSTLTLSPELIDAYKIILDDPEKQGLDFKPLKDWFAESDTAIPKHILFKQFTEVFPRDIPKIVFYIIMDERYKIKKADNGDLGYCVTIVI